MKLSNLIERFLKFAAIPQYNKCSNCGVQDPYIEPGGLCYNCFDPTKPIAKKEIENTNKWIEVLKKIKRVTPIAFNSKKIGEFYIEFYNDAEAEPEAILPSILDYKKIIILIVDANDALIYPHLDKRFKDFDWIKYFPTRTAAGLVPVKELPAILDDIEKLS